MPDYLIWLIAGLGLIIIEVMSGTFYLLVLGLAALAGALAAYWGAGTFVQVVCAGLLAGIGLLAVKRWHRSRPTREQQDPSLDLGQVVTLESWLDRDSKRVRVKYRGTMWDALLIGEADVQLNDTLYIHGAQGSELHVSHSPSTQ
jgi:membrane protein implicated in regulation of membrane protease activity